MGPYEDENSTDNEGKEDAGSDVNINDLDSDGSATDDEERGAALIAPFLVPAAEVGAAGPATPLAVPAPMDVDDVSSDAAIGAAWANARLSRVDGANFSWEDVYLQNEERPRSPERLPSGEPSASKRARDTIQQWTDNAEADAKCFTEVMEIGSKWGNRQIVEDFSYRAHNSQKIAKVLDTQADDARYLRAMAIARQDTSNEEHRYKDQMKKNIKNAKDEARVEALHILHEKSEDKHRT
jgi:hypothetical protein